VLGIVFLVTGQVLAGFSTKIWQLYLTQGFLFAVGLGLSMVVSGPIVTQWFGMKRAFAVGMVSAGSGGGALFYSNITRIALQSVGRKWACVIK
jgi:MFS family permease